MMEEYFEDSRTRERVRTSPSGSYLDGFSEWLRNDGYRAGSIQELLRTAVHLGNWVERRHTPLSALNEKWIDRFRTHIPRCSCPGPRPPRTRSHKIATRAALFLRYLRERGIASEAPPLPAPEVHPLVAGFEAWMCQHRGATPTTLRIYGRVLTDALHTLGGDPATFDACGVREFVLQRAKAQGRSKAKQVMSAMRVFLRYLCCRSNSLVIRCAFSFTLSRRSFSGTCGPVREEVQAIEFELVLNPPESVVQSGMKWVPEGRPSFCAAHCAGERSGAERSDQGVIFAGKEKVHRGCSHGGPDASAATVCDQTHQRAVRYRQSVGAGKPERVPGASRQSVRICATRHLRAQVSGGDTGCALLLPTGEMHVQSSARLPCLTFAGHSG
jgi:hypothetical protein